MNKIQLILLMLILQCSLVFGQLAVCNNVVASWSFDTNTSDDKYSFYAEPINAPTYVTGKSGTALDFESSSSQYLNASDRDQFSFTSGSPFCFSFWYKEESVGVNQGFLWKTRTTTIAEYGIYASNGQDYRFYLYENATAARLGSTQAANFFVGDWNFYVGCFNGSGISPGAGMKFYRNTTAFALTNDTTSPTMRMYNTNAPLLICAYNSAGLGGYCDGAMDDLTLYNASLSETNITWLYNHPGFYKQYCNITGPATPPLLVNITIWANQEYDGSPINYYNVTLSNSSYNVTVNVSGSGYAIFSNVTPILFNGTFNVSYTSDNQLSSFYSVQLNGTTTTYNNTMTEGYLDVRIKQIINNNYYSSFTSSLPSKSNTTTNGTARIPYNAGNYLLITSGSFWSNLTNITLTSRRIASVEVNTSSYQLNVSTTSYGSSVVNTTIIIERVDFDYSDTQNKFSSTGKTQFFVLNGTYNISVSAPGYSSLSQLLTISSSFYHLNVSLFESTAMNITFRDAQTKLLISTERIYFDLIGDTYAVNTSTTNGTLLFTLLVPLTYTMRYYSNMSYPMHYYTFTLYNQTYNNIDLYLHKNNIATNLSVQVVDQFSRAVSGATVYLERYDLPTNSYLTQQGGITDWEGKVYMQGQLYSEYYRFKVFYGGELRTTTEKTILTDTEYTIAISTTEGILESYKSVSAISASFTNYSTYFYSNYADADGIVSSACIKIEQADTKFGAKSFVSMTCSYSPTGSVNASYIPWNTTRFYTGSLYINKSGTENYFGSITIPYAQGIPSFGMDILWLIFLITLVLGFFAFTLHRSIGLIVLPLPMLLFAMLDMLPQEFKVGYIFAIEVVMIILAYVVA